MNALLNRRLGRRLAVGPAARATSLSLSADRSGNTVSLLGTERIHVVVPEGRARIVVDVAH